MNIHRIAVHTVEDEHGQGTMDFDDYSKFKYGYKPTAIRFADNLALKFLESHSVDYLIKNRENIIVSTSPYWYTPPSANALAIYFHYLMNELLIEKGCGPITFMKIHRSAAPSLDFSKLNSDERIENMKKDSLSFDPFILKGKALILIEDARITGSHESKIIDFMEKAGLKEITFLYVIDAFNIGQKDPDIENRMNHKWVNNLNTLQLLMKSPEEFILNSRACRMVLSWENKVEIEDFCKRLSDEMLFNLHIYSVNDGYATNDKFKEGFEKVRKETMIRYMQLKKLGNSGVPNFIER